LLSRLRNEFKGGVIGPDDHEYDEARKLFYSGIDRKPAAIIRAKNAKDVSRAVLLARESGAELSVRSGGHSLAGHSVSEGGIVLDLSAMHAIEIDASQRTAWAETGLTAGAYTEETAKHGLATGFGDAPTVGIGGITLGGGVGYLHRKFGLTIDSVIAAEVVTADGEIVRTDANTHPDLFWAIRGGGGNFGVVTRFQFRLHEVDRVVGGMLILPATPEVIESFMAESQAAPDELSIIAHATMAPPLPFIDKQYHGKPIIMSMLVFAGDPDAGTRALAPFRALAAPIADQVRPIRMPEIYAGAAEAPHPAAVSVRTLLMDTFDRSAAEIVLHELENGTAPMRVAQFRALGGAVARVPVDATAFAHRTRGAIVNVAAAYERMSDAPEQDAWAEAFAARLRHGEPGAYVGFIGDEGADRVREAYPGPTWDRLAAIKQRYDPTNLFRLNQNVAPAGAGAVS
jgi:FAD/FMN-containing dehydrogenase